MADHGTPRRVEVPVPRPDRTDRRTTEAREARQRDEMRDLARRDSFRRALLASGRETTERRDHRTAAARCAVERDEIEPRQSNEVVAAEDATEHRGTGDGRAGAEEPEVARDDAADVTAEPAPTDSVPSRIDRLLRDATLAVAMDAGASSGSEGQAQSGGGGRSGQRAFEFAERFRAFAEFRRSASGGLEIELLMPNTNASPSSLTIVAVAPRRVALRFKGEPVSACNVGEIVAELRDSGLEVVKAIESNSEASDR